MHKLLFAFLALVLVQAASDWQKRYGTPEVERFAIQEGISLTIYYSSNGQTCKAIIEANPPQPAGKIEDILKEVTPVAERGKLKQQIGFTSTVTGISWMQYERVAISMNSVTRYGNETVDSATISWNGLECRTNIPLRIEEHRPVQSPK